MTHLKVTLVILIFAAQLSAQTNDCEAKKDSAMKDFSKGIVRIYLFGSTDSYTYGKILKEEYGIDVVYGGNFIEDGWECYTELMAIKIKERHGRDIFDIAALKAERLDKSGKGDRKSEFPGGDEALRRFVYCNLSLDKSNYDTHGVNRVFMGFTINKKGKVKQIVVHKFPNEDYKNEAIRIVLSMPKWTNSTRNGKRISVKWVLPIVFDVEIKEKYDCN